MGVIMFLKKSLSVLILMVMSSIASANWTATDDSSMLFSLSSLMNPFGSTGLQFGLFGADANINSEIPTLIVSAEILNPASTIDWNASPASMIADNFVIAWLSGTTWYLPISTGPVDGFVDRYQLIFASAAGVAVLYATDIAPFEATAPIPVPSAIWMFGAGLVGLLSSVGRKKRISANAVTA